MCEEEKKLASFSRIGNYLMTGRCLGKGSFAKVYEAKHQHHNTIVALKTINVSTLEDVYMKKHFKREALLLSRLNHPAIVTLFEVMQTRNHYCIVMEFGGDSLCEFVQAQKRGRIDEAMVRIMARQLVSAVSHMHSMAIVHRDIKLENIFINLVTNKLKLGDFGLSNVFDRKTMLKTHCGSPEYAPPELHSGESYGFEVDIWALGVVLFAMVVGRLPFVVDSKRPVSDQKRRELLLDETKRGVKTKKHQVFMGSASFLFKDLMSKMLNPERQLRIKIEHIERHPWILGAFSEDYPPITEAWKSKMIATYAEHFNLSIEHVTDEIAMKPYGQLGGILNIEKHLHQVNKIALKKAPTRDFGMCKINPSIGNNKAAINRPTTAIGNNFISNANARQRPKTTRGKERADSPRPLNSKLRGAFGR